MEQRGVKKNVQQCSGVLISFCQEVFWIAQSIRFLWAASWNSKPDFPKHPLPPFVIAGHSFLFAAVTSACSQMRRGWARSQYWQGSRQPPRHFPPSQASIITFQLACRGRKLRELKIYHTTSMQLNSLCFKKKKKNNINSFYKIFPVQAQVGKKYQGAEQHYSVILFV